MKVDSTTSKFAYASMMDNDHDHDDDLLAMAGALMGDDHSQSSGNRSEMRKSNKPIMEKRRRARINNCLNDLKNILLEAMKKDPARHSKLEKADILELTVRHLQNIQRNQLAIAMATDPTVLHRFKNGFSECVTEVNRYMGKMDGADPGVRHRLLDHLGNCVNGLQQVGPAAPAPFGGSGPVSFPSANPCSTFPAAATVVPPAIGLHSSSPTILAATVASLRHNTAPMQQQMQLHPMAFSSDDLNNNLLRSAATAAAVHNAHDNVSSTSARLMSAFAVASGLPRRPLSPPSSPPASLNVSSSSHESLQLSASSRNDSGLSETSDIGSSTDTHSTSGVSSRSSISSSATRSHHHHPVTGDPLDFSIGKGVRPERSSAAASVTGSDDGSPRLVVGGNNSVRVVKVEPMPTLPMPSPDEGTVAANKDMWRPW